MTSIVGADQMPTPDGPHSVTPAAFLPAACGSGTMNVRQSDRAGLGVERVEAAAEGAALVALLAGRGFFDGRRPARRAGSDTSVGEPVIRA